MKISKDDYLIKVGRIVGALVYTPFIGVYHGVKWIYNQTPRQKQKERKSEREKLDMDIKDLERQLGLTGRLSGMLDYDPYYFKRNSNRTEYLECLRKKVVESYQSPDLILAIQEDSADNSLILSNHHMKVLLLANRNIYENPPHAKDSKLLLFSDNAKKYFEFTTNFFAHAKGIEGRLYTLSECSRYEDYFVVIIPGNFSRDGVSMSNETIKNFVEDFKKRYIKTSKQ